jgi:hypothetical protein
MVEVGIALVGTALIRAQYARDHRERARLNVRSAIRTASRVKEKCGVVNISRAA